MKCCRLRARCQYSMSLLSFGTSYAFMHDTPRKQWHVIIRFFFVFFFRSCILPRRATSQKKNNTQIVCWCNVLITTMALCDSFTSKWTHVDGKSVVISCLGVIPHFRLIFAWIFVLFASYSLFSPFYLPFRSLATWIIRSYEVFDSCMIYGTGIYTQMDGKYENKNPNWIKNVEIWIIMANISESMT